MAKIRETIVTNAEKKFLLKSLSENIRLDGRTFEDFRNIHIEFGKDYGCCAVTLGRTKILAQVSCEIQQPKSSRPSEGILNVNIELNPMAAPHFEAGRQSLEAVQLNRLLEKCIKDSKAVDLESLCIKAAEKVWAFRVDLNVLNHEGNIIDCASVAALAALTHFRRPDATCDGEEFIVHSYDARDPIPTVIHHYPVCITYGIFNGGQYVLADPDLLEEGVADAFLTIGLNAYRELCGLHLGGKAELSPGIIIQTTIKAGARAAYVIQLIKDEVEKDNQKRNENKSIGFHETILDSKHSAIEELTACLDNWSTNKRRKNRKVVASEEHEIENKTSCEEQAAQEQNQSLGEIESLGTGSAALIPNADGDKHAEWGASSEDDDDNEIQILDIPKFKVETVDLMDTDSEEEKVVVLNADKKTNKKKKIRN